MRITPDPIWHELPAEYPDSLLEIISSDFEEENKTLVVLDDDPTGTQTCTDVRVITSWESDLISQELAQKPAILYILTNSRSFPENEAVKMAEEIGQNIKKAVLASGRKVELISRSDSTLRGHFPAEVDALMRAIGKPNAVKVLIPAFIEGGRLTINDVHYLFENSRLTPVSETPFAKDVVFGYKNSDLKKWAEEKSKGSIKAENVSSISLKEIRENGPEKVAEKLIACPDGSTCLVNAANYSDLEVLSRGVQIAESTGKDLIFRSSATFVPIRSGKPSGVPYFPGKNSSKNGALIMVGSYVPKTTLQLGKLIESGKLSGRELMVSNILNSQNSAEIAQLINETDNLLDSGKDVLLYTSRNQEIGSDTEKSLEINAKVSRYLVDILKGISVRPKFIIAKGGITSSDLATKALSCKSAHVLGPVMPGIPVWKMGEESKFPGISYVVFPGNVGDENALLRVFEVMG